MAGLRELTVVKYQRRRKPPGPTARATAKKRRAEAPVVKRVRAICVERDGYCRLMGLSPCSGPSEWAHLEEKKRFKTRKMPPEERHTTTHSAQFCQTHHRLYDAGKIQIAMTAKGADGDIRAQLGTKVLMC